MPVILPEEHHDSWLSGEAGKEILVPFPADQMKAWPISARVNSPKNNDAEIIMPIELESVVAVGKFSATALMPPAGRDQSGCYILVLRAA
jgi:hypothetical protein